MTVSAFFVYFITGVKIGSGMKNRPGNRIS
jgi:hypothetical protein